MTKLFSAWEEPTEDEEEVVEEPQEDAVAEALDSFTEEEMDEQMSEAEHRLQLASYYKQLVKGGIFNDGSEEANIVDEEVRQFARGQMAKLLNLGGAAQKEPEAIKVELPFNDKEVIALKAVAKRVLAQQGETPGEPTIRKVEPPKPVQTSKPKAPVPPKRKPQPPVKPTPGKKPAPKKPAPSAAAKNTEPEVKEVLQEEDLPKLPNGEIDFDSIPTMQEFVHKGTRYKFVPHPNEDNKRVRLNVNRQVGNKQAMPMPTAKQMESISFMQAQQQLSLLDDVDQTVHVAAALAMKP